jgi:hypothetical protein
VFEGPVQSGFSQFRIETATTTGSIKFKNYIKLNRTAQNWFIMVQTSTTTGISYNWLSTGLCQSELTQAS